jgi:hypothetical protein
MTTVAQAVSAPFVPQVESTSDINFGAVAEATAKAMAARFKTEGIEAVAKEEMPFMNSLLKVANKEDSELAGMFNALVMNFFANPGAALTSAIAFGWRMAGKTL